MIRRKTIYGVLLALLALSAILGIIIFYARQDQALHVIFFDVGQGDAILVSQGQNQLLIDGGKDGKIILEKLGKYVPFWDRTIETVIATHPDQDHIGGLINVAKNYEIGAVLETNATSDSQTYNAWEDAITGVEKIEAKKGIDIKFPSGAEVSVEYPFSSIINQDPNSNDYSVVAKLNFGENKFLFTGDLPAEKEAELVAEKADLKAGVLKISHHGSKYATSSEFLDAVNPEEAVISVGKNNAYGHPAPEVVDRLLKAGIKIWRTDELGDIKYICANLQAPCAIAN